MKLFNIYRNTTRCCSGLAVLLMILSLFSATALAVEAGKLSVTAEGVTAARALYHMHPDEKIRNGDYMAKQMVHPDYYHYSLYCSEFDIGMEVVKTYRQTIVTYVNARTKHMDGILEEAGKNGIRQMVNLGAGYDSRAYRYHKSMPDVRFFEIELPAMVVEKKRRVKEILGEVPDYVTFVPIDFNTQNIPDELAKAGYNPSLKTLFIWEGVTYYISAEAVAWALHTLRAWVSVSGPIPRPCAATGRKTSGGCPPLTVSNGRRCMPGGKKRLKEPLTGPDSDFLEIR